MNFAHLLARRAMASLEPSMTPFVIAICGWADTGKSTLAGNLCQELRASGCDADRISTDAFLLDRETRNSLGITGYNPASLDASEMLKAISNLSCGGAYEYYPYDNRTGKRSAQMVRIDSLRVVVVEGIHALHVDLLPRLHFKVFIDAEADVLAELRIQANMRKRGMGAEEAIRRVARELEDFKKFTAPAKQFADWVASVSRGYEYSIGTTEPAIQC